MSHPEHLDGLPCAALPSPELAPVPLTSGLLFPTASIMRIPHSPPRSNLMLFSAHLSQGFCIPDLFLPHLIIFIIFSFCAADTNYAEEAGCVPKMDQLWSPNIWLPASFHRW